MRFIPYNKTLKDFSRQLRNNSTFGEIILWNRLQGRGMMGYQFNRQKPLDNYIVDFYCHALNLVIEIDGRYHFSEETCVSDEQRENILQQKGLHLLRFSETEARYHRENVMRAIENYILDFEERNPGVMEKKERKKNRKSP